jgi:hypothetical protein
VDDSGRHSASRFQARASAHEIDAEQHAAEIEDDGRTDHRLAMSGASAAHELRTPVVSVGYSGAFISINFTPGHGPANSVSAALLEKKDEIGANWRLVPKRLPKANG